MTPGSPRRPLVRKMKTLVKLLRQRAFGEKHERERAGYALLDKAHRVLLPDYKLTEYGRLWFYDSEYFDQYRRLGIEDDLSADRKFLLRELLRLASRDEGDTVETGVYNGASSCAILAVDEYMAERPEPVMHFPTGQGVIIKAGSQDQDFEL